MNLHGLVFGPNGVERLCLFYEPVDQGGSNFHSIVWERSVNNVWRPHITITREQFQGGSTTRRWVSELFSLDPQRGWSALQVAEGDRPEGRLSVTYRYSWRTWDLVNNLEIGILKRCSDPFDPL